MKYLIVGLGNIGEEYAATRHNIGFMTLDAFAEASNVSFATERYGDIARMRLKNKQLVLLKPSTYMNLSGNAVRYWRDKESIDPDNILVVVDDIALPFGAIRIKQRGSDAGHNGLKSIIQHLGTDQFPRLRVGVGEKPHPDYDMADWVLGKFVGEDKKAIDAAVKRAADAIECILAEGVDRGMGKFNG